MSFENAIQVAIYQTLSSDSTLMASVTGVYDTAPQALDAGAADNFPYVTIGEDTHIEWDTDTELGADVTVTIHVWSRDRGRKETKTIQGLIYGLLHRASLSISGYNLVGVDWLQSDSFLDTDGLTRHGVQTFRITVEE
jgi:hypothetical protein